MNNSLSCEQIGLVDSYIPHVICWFTQMGWCLWFLDSEQQSFVSTVAFLPVFTSYVIFGSFLFWCFVFTLNHPVLNFSGLILSPFLAIEYILNRSVFGYTVPLTVGKIGCRCLFKNSVWYHDLCWDELSGMSAPKFHCGPLGMQWNKNRQLLNCNQGIFHMLFEEKWKLRR